MTPILTLIEVRVTRTPAAIHSCSKVQRATPYWLAVLQCHIETLRNDVSLDEELSERERNAITRRSRLRCYSRDTGSRGFSPPAIARQQRPAVEGHPRGLAQRVQALPARNAPRSSTSISRDRTQSSRHREGFARSPAHIRVVASLPALCCLFREVPLSSHQILRTPSRSLLLFRQIFTPVES